MKKTLVFLPFLLYAGILSDIKVKELSLEKEKSIASSNETKKSWINPILLQYQFNHTNSLHVTRQNTQTFSIIINQPIFKSGAIYYSIKYAKNLKNYNLKQIELQKRNLIKSAYDLVYDYKITKLNEEIALLNIKNAEIDVKRKKEDYLSGTSDSTFLNQAIISLNNIRLSLEDLKFNEKQIIYSFANLSDLDINSVSLPKLKLLKKDEFLDKNLNLIASKLNNKIQYSLYKMQLGNQLVSVSFNANYNIQKIDYTNENNIYKDDTNNFYNVGVSVSLPIDVTSKDKIQKTKLSYLKSKYETLDKKRELINEYKMIIAQIDTLKKKKKIYKENAIAYKNLIDSTYESIKAGSATKDDLTTLQNSYKIMLLNQKIVDLKVQKLLLNLYYQINSNF